MSTPVEGQLSNGFVGKVNRLARSARRGGPGAVLAHLCRALALRFWAIRDRAFDRRFGVDTACGVDLSELTMVGGNAHRGVFYMPTPVGQFARMMALLPIDPADYAFADIGSGKGRCVLLASGFPFKRVTGVEFARELHALAQRNVRDWPGERIRCGGIVLQNRDVLDFRLEDGNAVIFLYNPFCRSLTAEFRDLLESEIRRHEGTVYVVYLNPRFDDLFDASPRWRRLETPKSAFDRFANPIPYAIFRSGSEDRRRTGQTMIRPSDGRAKD